MAGMLYLVPTPIGNLGDISPRAKATLESADFIAAEDTRVTLKLLNHLELRKPLVSYYEHNKSFKGEKILDRILAGETCALVSDAGSPAISDPGEDLVRQCAQAGVTVCAIPGPCAVITALSISGQSTGRFCFEGFLSTAKKSRREHLDSLKSESRTMVFYEAPHKLVNTLEDMAEVFGPDRPISLYRELTKPDLPAARIAVSRIVGRDTAALTAEGVTKAAVETVAENASDGVIAPLLYMLLGGAPLALTYKAINTMDSMVGYKNEQYLHFGRAAAKLDDIANYLPSRIAALLWVAAAALTGNDARNAWRIWRRDRRNHASPNSAQTESACAGALNVQLAGPAYYFGEYYPKPTIGDAVRPIEPEDIRRADRMMYAESLLALALGLLIRGIL